ncbi:MAG: hypothetical protein JW863_04635 [Chitinispirillaceae bacterium]|nr:hypothetical protein [Chitinispirillaceae bacterium]
MKSMATSVTVADNDQYQALPLSTCFARTRGIAANNTIQPFFKEVYHENVHQHYGSVEYNRNHQGGSITYLSPEAVACFY